MKLEKRGAIEVQFNWIFILIAGTVILLFFGTIIMKQRAVAEEKLSASLLIDLDSIMTGSMVSKNAFNFISIPKKEINFQGCDFYYIGKKNEENAKLKKDIKERVIFTPDLIKGTKLTIWVLPWEIPYRVANFVYLTSPEVRYIIVANDIATGSFADKIDKLLPPRTTIIDEEEYTVMFKDTTTSTSFSDLNNYKVKLILLDTVARSSINPSDFETDDVDLIEVNGDLDSGTINFYKKSGGSWIQNTNIPLDGTSPYLRGASLIGAIFAEDEGMYECAMQNAFNRMRVVSSVYYERTDNLPTAGCGYTDALNKLANIRDASGTFQQIITKIKDNQITYQDKNCPLVY